MAPPCQNPAAVPLAGCGSRRHVFYRLRHPDVAEWVLAGLRFLEADLADVVQRRLALGAARQVWNQK